MKNYQLLIISSKQLNPNLFADINYIQLDNITIKEMYRYNDFTYDYLITDCLSAISVLEPLIENGKIVTNCFYQTSIDDLFAFGDIVNDEDYLVQLQQIIDFLKDLF